MGGGEGSPGSSPPPSLHSHSTLTQTTHTGGGRVPWVLSSPFPPLTFNSHPNNTHLTILSPSHMGGPHLHSFFVIFHSFFVLTILHPLLLPPPSPLPTNHPPLLHPSSAPPVNNTPLSLASSIFSFWGGGTMNSSAPSHDQLGPNGKQRILLGLCKSCITSLREIGLILM